MKYLVETNGDYGLMDLFGGQHIAADRPSVVRNTGFIETQKGSKLTVLEILADEATDEMLANAEDLEAAIADLPRPKKDEPVKAEAPKPAAAKPAAAKPAASKK